MTTELLDQAKALCPGDQLELVEALWNQMALRDSIPPPTDDAQRPELERRLTDHEAKPEDMLAELCVQASVSRPPFQEE